MEILIPVATLVFVVGSMVAMGLSLTVPAILGPLRDTRLVVIVLALNFVLAPALAWGLAELLRLDAPLRTGLLLIATAAGAPFLPKLVQMAKGDPALGVGLMVLLMVATVVTMPIVLPLLIRGVEVAPWAIARSLIFLMLLPLGLSLYVRSRSPDLSERIQPIAAQAANIALVVIIFLGVVLNFSQMIDLIGSRGLIAAALLIALLCAAGMVATGKAGVVVGLASGQRNIAAAVVVAGQNFGPDVLTYVLVSSMVGLILLLAAAAALGKRAPA